MKRATVLLPVFALFALFALPLAAQSYYAQIDGANCSVLWGYAWDSTQPNTPISIDLYDGAAPLGTILANQAYAGIGNGYHGFVYTIPPSLKDGATHTIVHYVTGTHINISGSTGTINCPAGTTGYVLYSSDPLTSINTSNWYDNGSVSGTSSGLTATSSSGGSLISKVAVPGGGYNYEVRMTLDLIASGGTYVSYLRATTNAETGPSIAGTFYSVEVTPTFSGSSCTGSLALNKTVSGSQTTMGTNTIPCNNGTIVRSIVNGGILAIWVDGTCYIATTDSSPITTGSPGVGALATPSGNSISLVALGPGDSTAPSAPSSATFETFLLPTRMDFRFAGVPDDSAGTGVAFYQLYRDGSFLGQSSQPEFTDETLTASTTHSYSIYAFDFAWNSAHTTFSITTPPTGSVDDRRVGVRPTGAYWGASPEQIDLLSGNLNFTIPLLSAQMRGGGAVPINLTYNSQNWRKGSSGDWNLGTDVGYGYGWRLSAGSLTPFITYPWIIDHFTFVDATGAEYRLDQNSGSIWSSKESVYVWYDASSSILHFRDGSFWIMGCTSAGTEPDSGTMYPTTIENSNGNQIVIHYNAGNLLTYVNSSARIEYIDDVRAVPLGSPPLRQTYVFVYNFDTPAHLTSVQNTIGTSEAYQFAFGSMATLYDPFTGTGYSYANALVPLQSMTATGIGMEHSFTYNSSGEMTQAIFPYAGYFKYNYGSVTYSSGFTQREISSRVMSKDGTSGSEVTYPFTHESSPSSYPIHQFTSMADPGGVGQKYWAFSQSSPTIGLVSQYQGQKLPGPTTLVQNDFTWTQDSAGNSYIASTLNTYPGPAYTKVSQTVDTHGNVTQVLKYQFGSLTTPARTYNYSYLNSSSYTNLYIYNRLTTSTVTDGTTTIYLASNGYDSNSQYVAPFTTNPQEWDTSYASASYRGNLTSSTTPSGS